MDPQRSPSSAAVLAEGLTKRFGDETAVDGLDLAVPSGHIVGLIGPSGCGKTTTVRLLTGAFRPTAGRAELFGQDPTLLSARQRRRIGYLPQRPILFDRLTLWQNLSFNASLYGLGLRRRKRLYRVLDFTELTGHEHKRVDRVSGGMQRRLALAATLAHDPEVLFLDEPTAGIDPILRRKFWERFRQLRDEGRTFLVTTQQVAEAVYCDTVAVIAEGHLIAADTPTGLRRRAFGGDLVDVCTTTPLAASTVEALAALPLVIGPPVRLSPTAVRLPVADASGALPDLVSWLTQQGIEIESSGEHVPDYDDVFVRLVERDRAQRAEADAPQRADDEAVAGRRAL